MEWVGPFAPLLHPPIADGGLGPYSGEVGPFGDVAHFARTSEHVVVVPLKSFASAKSRLRDAGTSDVTSMAERLAHSVLQNCDPRPVFVVCESDDVERFATANGAGVIRSPHAGLNHAVSFAYHQLGTYCERVSIIHGDLRFPEGLGGFEPRGTITIVADRHGSGTNILSLPTGLSFRFQYGVGSALRHRYEAERLGIDVETLTDSPWRFDIDVPEDLSVTDANGGPSAPHSLGTTL